MTVVYQIQSCAQAELQGKGMGVSAPELAEQSLQRTMTKHQLCVKSPGVFV